MKEYHKIQTVFLRDPAAGMKTLLAGQYALPEFAYLAGNEWVWTEKVDGTCTRIMFDGETIRFGGKTDEAQIHSALVARLIDRFLPMLPRFKEVFAPKDGEAPAPVCLYGEGYGAKIQKGGDNYRPDQDFVLFDVKIGEWWLARDSVTDIAAKLGIDVVPVVGRGTLPEMVEFVRAGYKSTWGNFPAEGVVARPAVELKARSGQRIITKVKTKDFART
ncbi:MAG: RNA ligase family protein [Lentisphaeria bacterium]